MHNVNIKVKCIYDICDLDGLLNDSDPYVKVFFNGNLLGTTTIELGVTNSFCWNQYFSLSYQVNLNDGDFTVKFEVYDEDDNEEDLIGIYTISTTALNTNDESNLSGGEDSSCSNTRLSYEIDLV